MDQGSPGDGEEGLPEFFGGGARKFRGLAISFSSSANKDSYFFTFMKNSAFSPKPPFLFLNKETHIIEHLLFVQYSTKGFYI